MINAGLRFASDVFNEGTDLTVCLIHVAIGAAVDLLVADRRNRLSLFSCRQCLADIRRIGLIAGFAGTMLPGLT
jgi:hypothetical protein